MLIKKCGVYFYLTLSVCKNVIINTFMKISERNMCFTILLPLSIYAIKNIYVKNCMLCTRTHMI